MSNDNIQELVDEIQNATNKNKGKDENYDINDENVQNFLFKYTSELIKNAVEYVSEYKEDVAATPQPEEVEALAKLVNSSAAAIESLNKIKISNDKNKTAKQIKQMDIESKKQLQEEKAKTQNILLNREELLKELLKDADIIEAEEVNEVKPHKELPD